jgi:hypothetical protein
MTTSRLFRDHADIRTGSLLIPGTSIPPRSLCFPVAIVLPYESRPNTFVLVINKLSPVESTLMSDKIQIRVKNSAVSQSGLDFASGTLN